MKALLYKDFLVLWKQMKFVIFMVAIFCMMPDTGLSLNAFFVAYSGLIVPVTLFAYDERAKWDSLAAMMPFSTRDMVLSRYVFSWLAIAYAGLCYLAGLLLFQSGLLEEYAIVKGTAEQLEALMPAAVAGKKINSYGAQALVRRNGIPTGFVTEHTSLEDIILFLAQEGGESR